MSGTAQAKAARRKAKQRRHMYNVVDAATASRRLAALIAKEKLIASRKKGKGK